MAKTPSKLNGRVHPKRTAIDITISRGDDIVISASTTALTKWRLASEVVAPKEVNTAAADIGVTIETRLVLASQIIGLDLREILVYHQTSF